MYNHAAWINHERSEKKYDLKHKRETSSDAKDPVIPETGKRMSELKEDPKMFSDYMSDWRGFQV